MKNKSRFYYRGRERDALKIGGVWVSPTLMENAIIEHEAVSECAVIEKKNEDGLPKPKACLLYTSPSPRDVEESRMPSSA